MDMAVVVVIVVGVARGPPRHHRGAVAERPGRAPAPRRRRGPRPHGRVATQIVAEFEDRNEFDMHVPEATPPTELSPAAPDRTAT